MADRFGDSPFNKPPGVSSKLPHLGSDGLYPGATGPGVNPKSERILPPGIKPPYKDGRRPVIGSGDKPFNALKALEDRNKR